MVHSGSLFVFVSSVSGRIKNIGRLTLPASLW